MSPWVTVAGGLAGCGVYLLVRQLRPDRLRLDDALESMEGSAGIGQPRPLWMVVGRWLTAASWVAVPSADLAMLDRDRERWAAEKAVWALAGFAAPVLLATLAALVGYRFEWPVPAGGSIAAGTILFFVPDLVTRRTASRRRSDFRNALASYLDLVVLERGAGAGPTQALEAAAQIGGGWAFARIAAALEMARRTGRPPWAGLAELAASTGVSELADLADVSEIAGQEGARVLATLAARAASMRAEALAAARASAGVRNTTMVVPIALLGAGFLVLLIFPIVYRTFG